MSVMKWNNEMKIRNENNNENNDNNKWIMAIMVAINDNNVSKIMNE